MISVCRRLYKYTIVVCVLLFMCLYYQEHSLKTDSAAPINPGLSKKLRVSAGTINVGQEKEIEILIPNHSSVEMKVERLSVCCGNAKPWIDLKSIKPGEVAKVVQKITRKKVGKFDVKVHVVFKKTRQAELIYVVEGEAVQPISAFVGWDDEMETKVDTSLDAIRLGSVHYLSKKSMTIRLVSRQKDLDLKNAIVSSKANYFSWEAESVPSACVHDKSCCTKKMEKKSMINAISPACGVLSENVMPEWYDPVRVTDENMLSTKDIPRKQGGKLICDGCNGSIKGLRGDVCLTKKSTLNLKLIVRNTLPIGELADTITVALKDGTKCYIPLVFRSVSNVYGDKTMLGLGDIASGDSSQCKFRIVFTNNASVWQNLSYEVSGDFVDAIKVSSIKKGVDFIDLGLEVDGRQVASNIEGFVKSRLSFYDVERQKEGVSLLVYGYK